MKVSMGQLRLLIREAVDDESPICDYHFDRPAKYVVHGRGGSLYACDDEDCRERIATWHQDNFWQGRRIEPNLID